MTKEHNIEDRPFLDTFTTPYDSANHVLQTALSYCTVHMFGVSELALRLPTLLAAPFYFIAIWRIAFRSFRGLGFSVLALGIMALNPLLLDHLSLARGYGLGLTMFAWSLYLSLQYDRDRNPRALIPAAALLGMSIGANLTFAIPASGLALLMLFALPLRLAVRYLSSAMFCVVIVLAAPLLSARLSDFYYGQPNAEQSLTNLIEVSLFYHGRLPLFHQWTDSYRSLIGLIRYGIVPMLLGIGTVWIATFRTARLLRVAGGSLLVSIAVLLIAHYAIDLKYPSDRTGLYLLFLFPLAFIAAVDALFDSEAFMRWKTARWAVAPGIVVMAVVIVVYCLEFHVGKFAQWPYALDPEQYTQMIRARSPEGNVRIGGTFVFSYLVNFYRDKHHADWLEVFDFSSLTEGYDYYILLPKDREYVDRLGLRILADTGESVLAAPL